MQRFTFAAIISSSFLSHWKSFLGNPFSHIRQKCRPAKMPLPPAPEHSNDQYPEPGTENTATFQPDSHSFALQDGLS